MLDRLKRDRQQSRNGPRDRRRAWSGRSIPGLLARPPRPTSRSHPAPVPGTSHETTRRRTNGAGDVSTSRLSSSATAVGQIGGPGTHPGVAGSSRRRRVVSAGSCAPTGRRRGCWPGGRRDRQQSRNGPRDRRPCLERAVHSGIAGSPPSTHEQISSRPRPRHLPRDHSPANKRCRGRSTSGLSSSATAGGSDWWAGHAPRRSRLVSAPPGCFRRVVCPYGIAGGDAGQADAPLTPSPPAPDTAQTRSPAR